MLGKIRGWSAFLAGLCSLIFIFVEYWHRPFPLEVWELDESPAAKWILLFIFACGGMAFAMFLWLWIFDWTFGNPAIPNVLVRIKNKLFLKSEYHEFHDKLRTLEFSLKRLIKAVVGSFLALGLADVLPDKLGFFLSRAGYCFAFVAVASLALFLISWMTLRKKVQKEMFFVNSEQARVIIYEKYEEADFIFQEVLKKLFPIQLYYH